MKRKFRDLIQNCIRAQLSTRSAQPDRSRISSLRLLRNIKYFALIFKYSNPFHERVKITTCPFFSLAALNYGYGRIVPGEMQIGEHSRLQFVTSFRTDFMQFIVENDKDIQAR